MSNQKTKTVDYFGHKIEIPVGHKYVAMDETGRVYSYLYRPFPAKTQGIWLSTVFVKDMNLCVTLRAADLKGRPWYESLCEYAVPQSKESRIERRNTAVIYFKNEQETTMKKIETRTVEYYGAEIEIPAHYNFIATDKNGEVYSYEYKPTFTDNSTEWKPQSDDVEYVPYYLNKDCNWQESLREYPSLKPSTVEPKSKRAKQFAEWFDKTFTGVDLGNSAFDPTDPFAVLLHVKNKTDSTSDEIRAAVIKHIDEYTVPQYGDYPNDNVEKWSKQHCIDMVAKYKAREGTSQRSEGNLDYWKMMHYSQLADCKSDEHKEDSMIAELLLASKAVTSVMTPDGVLIISRLDAKGTWHGLEFDYRDWMLSVQTEKQAKLELTNRIVQWVDEIKKEG